MNENEKKLTKAWIFLFGYFGIFSVIYMLFLGNINISPKIVFPSLILPLSAVTGLMTANFFWKRSSCPITPNALSPSGERSETWQHAA
jgi:hypothetical protein